MADPVHVPTPRRHVLAVHGYAVTADDLQIPSFTAPAEAVCQRVSIIHESYDHLFMLGGWDDSSLPADTTIGMAMRARLITLGVPSEKILVPQEILELERFMPPRDTGEERVLLSQFIHEVPGMNEAAFDAIIAEPWQTRVERIYKRLGELEKLKEPEKPERYIPLIVVLTEVDPDLRLNLKIAEWLSVFDPLGRMPIISWPFKNNRKKRSFKRPTQGQSWLTSDF